MKWTITIDSCNSAMVIQAENPDGMVGNKIKEQKYRG